MRAFTSSLAHESPESAAFRRLPPPPSISNSYASLSDFQDAIQNVDVFPFDDSFQIEAPTLAALEMTLIGFIRHEHMDLTDAYAPPFGIRVSPNKISLGEILQHKYWVFQRYEVHLSSCGGQIYSRVL